MQSEMVTFLATVRAVFDDAPSEKRALARKGEDESDFFCEVATFEAMGYVDADPGLTHVPGLEYIESAGPHDLDFDGRDAGRRHAGIQAARTQQGGNGKTSHESGIGCASGRLEFPIRASLFEPAFGGRMDRAFFDWRGFEADPESPDGGCRVGLAVARIGQ